MTNNCEQDVWLVTPQQRDILSERYDPIVIKHANNQTPTYICSMLQRYEYGNGCWKAY